MYAGSYPFGQRSDTYSSTGALERSQTEYYHKDRLGSIIAISTDNGSLVERRSFDAWGKRRNFNGTEKAPSFRTGSVRHGFTGHEDLGEVGLIHMNGRVYDPMMARFLSPDPQVQYPELMQNYNRYSYINNSPLRTSDPSGYGFFDDMFEAIGEMFGTNPVLRIGVTVAFAQFAPIDLFGAISTKAGLAAVNGAAAGAITSGGNLRATIAGGISGAAFSWAGGVGDTFGEFSAQHFVAHAAAGCFGAAAGGGNCGTGAISSVASLGAFKAGNGWDKAARVSFSIIVGGTISELGGGNFANGAISSAFAYAFNHDAHGGGELGDADGDGIEDIFDTSPEPGIQYISDPLFGGRGFPGHGVGQFAANKAAGKAAEAQAAKDLVAEGNTILGSQVSVRTAAGRRVIDHLVQDAKGTIRAVEVKSGGAVRNASQHRKDNALATQGGTFVGKNAPASLRGQKGIIETVERRY